MPKIDPLNGHPQNVPKNQTFPPLVISMLIMHGFLQDFNSISGSKLFFRLIFFLSIIKNVLQMRVR